MFTLSNKKALSQRFKCIVKLLNPGEEIELDYSHSSTGQDLLNELVIRLDLPDKDYYGLKMHDKITWVDLSKTIIKQTKGLDNVIFDLRFKFYPAEPALLASEATRYYLYLQLRSDLLEGRLRTEDEESTAYLIACILQSELGDYNLDPKKGDEATYGNYVSEFKFVPNQTQNLEYEAMKLHQNEDFVGLKPADSELNFLKKASRLDMYGIDPYPARDGNSRNHLLIGVNHLGISTFQDSKKVNQFSWEYLERLALDGRTVLIHCKKIDKKGGKVRPMFGFRCASQEHAQSFWKLATEHKYFFTLENTPENPIVTSSGGLFKKTHKVRYISRVEKDLIRDSQDDDDRRSPLKRSHSLLSKSYADSSRPVWQGFQQGKNLQGSLNNIYANELINKTMPSDLGCFREDDEDADLSQNAPNSTSKNRRQSKQRPSSGSIGNSKDNGSVFTGRKQTLITKSEYQTIDETRRTSIDKTNGNSSNQDVLNTCIFILTIVSIAIVAILMVEPKNRPSSINLLVRKANLDKSSEILRETVYKPAKAAFQRLFAQIKTPINH